ncbi:peptidase inhibitor family I36 protein [Nonomuraea sp. NPDC048916]|uniref:peptidase inhibitor family I36 protein n=1 Tax=Nonomuraea sp. NPDC048916 TaxID=3154232 RepID=UPI00340DC18E
MTFKKRLGIPLAALTLALTGAVATASPAQADYTDCFSGRLCFWQDYEYSGTLGMYSPSTSCYSMGVMNNETTSVYNRSGRTVRLYDSGNCTGDYYSISNGFRVWNLRYGPQGSNWNDRISSFKQV